MVFYDCKRKHPWYPNFGYPGELRVQTFPELYPPKTMEELPEFQEKIRDIVDQGLRDDPKGRQQKAVEIEEQLAKAV